MPDRILPFHSLDLAPVPELLRRLRAELAADFRPDRPTRLSRAPGRLDVMGGIADYTGSMVCEMTLDRAAAAAIQDRDDRNVQVFSFNLLDEHLPFTLRVPLDSLVVQKPSALRGHFAQPGRSWAAYIAGCLAILHDERLVDLKATALKGLNIAILSDVPLGAGVSSSAAIEIATMVNLLDHLDIRGRLGDGPDAAMKIAALCQRVENEIVGAPCGIMDQATSCAGRAGTLLRMVCQPHELLSPLEIPEASRFIGINSNVKHSVGGGMYGTTRCAAFMGHRMILSKMAELGERAGKTLVGDPMRGYLANLDPEDYKQFFRPYLPSEITGREFLDRYGGTVDTATRVEPDRSYHVMQATDHHVLEAMRVRNFVKFLQEATQLPHPSPQRTLALDKAGHLMYASHLSYTNDAKLGADECDLLVKLVRHREVAGLYGAKITGGGSGGTVAVLARVGDRADEAIGEILREYEKQTGRKAQALTESGPGAMEWGTEAVSLG